MNNTLFQLYIYGSSTQQCYECQCLIKEGDRVLYAFNRIYCLSCGTEFITGIKDTCEWLLEDLSVENKKGENK